MPDFLNRRRGWLMAILIVNSLVQVAAMSFIAILIRQALQSVGEGGGAALTAPVIGLFGANLLFGILKWHEMVISQRMGEDFALELRRSAFHHLSNLSLRAQTRLRGGSLQLRFVNDLTAIRNWISHGLSRLVSSIIVCLGAACALFWLDTSLGLVLGGIVLLALAGAIGIGGLLDQAIRRARKRRGQIAANIAEKLANLPVIQAFAHLNIERRKLKRQAQRLADAQVAKARVTGVFRGFMIFVVGSAIAAMVAVSSWTSGPEGPDTASLVAAIGLFSLISPNLFRLGRVYEYWKSARIATEKLDRLFSLSPVIEPAPEPKKPRRKFSGLQLKDVSLGEALRSINCRVEPADRIVLKGPNGSGKTTLLNLILRLVEPDSGRVLLSGRDIQTIRTGDLRRQISIISPSLGVMKGTIRSNIAYGSSRANDSDVERAAARCEMDGHSTGSPFFLERPVTEGGQNLSAGERMRVIMARALVCSPRLLLLDEPETHLDPPSLQLLLKLLESQESAWLATSHGHALDHLANRSWKMDGGELDTNPEKDLAA